MSADTVDERAYAKLNLILHVARPRADGMHPLGSIFASIDLFDDIHVEPANGAGDSVECAGLDGPNLAEEALGAFRRRVPELPRAAGADREAHPSRGRARRRAAPTPRRSCERPTASPASP